MPLFDTAPKPPAFSSDNQYISVGLARREPEYARALAGEMTFGNPDEIFRRNFLLRRVGATAYERVTGAPRVVANEEYPRILLADSSGSLVEVSEDVFEDMLLDSRSALIDREVDDWLP
ncbi:MAG: hypothetical protein ACHQT9_02475 [Candidatus Saccharimonadales bacterium]